MSTKPTQARPVKPDPELQKKKLAEIDAEIEQLKTKLNGVKDRISGLGNANSESSDRTELRNRLRELRDQQASAKQARSEIFEAMNAAQTSMKKKSNDLKLLKAKLPFRNLAELDAHIQKLEAQVESGQMKLVDEKRVINEISTLKRNRKQMDSLTELQRLIDSDKSRADQLRKKLDDAGTKALSEEYETIQAQLDKINKEQDANWSKRNELFSERNAMQKQVDEAYQRRRHHQGESRRAQDEWYKWQNEERARKVEREKKMREEEEKAKQKEAAERELEAASIPVFDTQITGCVNVRSYLQQFVSTEEKSPEKLLEKKKQNLPEGAVVLRKEEDDYFVGGKGKRNRKTEEKVKFTLPLSIIEILTDLEVKLPLSKADVPACLGALAEKQKYYEENQDRLTAENREKVEKKLAALLINNEN